MNEYLAEKILKEYEIKCESNKKFPYLMLFNTVFACFFLVLSCIYVFEMLLSGKPSCWFYVCGFFVIVVILISHIVIEYSANRRPLVTVEKSTKYAEQVHFIKILNTLRSPLWFWKRHNKFLSLLCLFCFYCFNFEYSSRNDFPCKVIR